MPGFNSLKQAVHAREVVFTGAIGAHTTTIATDFVSNLQESSRT
jgi:hypothetical protein